MKKIALIPIILLLPLTMSSCTVNWFDKHFDVPWWAILIPIVVFSAIAFIAGGKHIASQEYICSKCGKHFYPKWWTASVSLHINDDRYFKCPHCKKHSYCSPSHYTNT